MSLIRLLAVIFLAHQAAAAFVEVTLRHFEPMVKGESNHVNFDEMRIKKVNRTHHAFLGKLETFKEFGNNYKVSAYMYKMSGNVYKKMPYTLGPDGWCDFIKKYADIYQQFKPVSDYPAVEDCPWAPRVYTLHGLVIANDGFPPFLGGGDYQMQLQVHLGDTFVNGFNLFINILTLLA